MIYRLAYCEDDNVVGSAFSRKISAAFEKRGLRASVVYFSSPLTLEESILSGDRYDALFVDVDMPELSGISLCSRLQKHGFQSSIIFLSNRDDMVYKALQVRPVRFVRKSHFAEEIGECISALLRQIKEERAESVLFQSGKEAYRLYIRQILYLEIANQTLTIQLQHSQLNLKFRMNDAEELLIPYGFLRIHKSFLVNYRSIFSILKDRIVLTNGQELPLSRHRYGEVTAALLEWTRKELRYKGGNE